VSRLVVTLFGVEVLVIEGISDEEYELEAADNARLTTSDHSFGFAEEPGGYWEDEERA
jgi:hypothetical protein